MVIQRYYSFIRFPEGWDRVSCRNSLEPSKDREEYYQAEASS